MLAHEISFSEKPFTSSRDDPKKQISMQATNQDETSDTLQ